MDRKKPTALAGILFFIDFLSDVPKTKSERIIFTVFKYSGYAVALILLLMGQLEKIPFPTKNYVDAALLSVIMTFFTSFMLVCIIGIGRSKGNNGLWGQIGTAFKGVWRYILFPAIIVTVTFMLVMYFVGYAPQ